MKNGIPTKGKNTIRTRQEITVPSSQYVVLGDNREDSMDSRNWGFVDEEEIIGRAFLVYSPLENFKIVQQH